MERRAIWTLIARDELKDIAKFIGRDDGRPSTATKIVREIRQAVCNHASKELPGRHHSCTPSDWLYFQHKRWSVFYRPHKQGIEVMRVIDSARDLPRAFDASKS